MTDTTQKAPSPQNQKDPITEAQQIDETTQAHSETTPTEPPSEHRASIKQKIMSLSGESEFDKLEYTNLILDDLNLQQITDEDKEYLEGFTECQYLSLNSTQLKSLHNLPKLPKLVRLDIMDNTIESGLEMIFEQYGSMEGEDAGLRVLKLGNNRIKDFQEIEKLKGLTKLMQLDLTKNPINEGVQGLDLQFLGKEAGEEGFREKLVKEYINSEYYKKVREILPNLEVLDQFDREGNEFESDEDESDPGDL